MIKFSQKISDELVKNKFVNLDMWHFLDKDVRIDVYICDMISKSVLIEEINYYEHQNNRWNCLFYLPYKNNVDLIYFYRTIFTEKQLLSKIKLKSFI